MANYHVSRRADYGLDGKIRDSDMVKPAHDPNPLKYKVY